MSDAANAAFAFFYIGSLIVNPPIVGGRTLQAAPDSNGKITYTFRQPVTPCADPKCSQEIFRIERNPDSCWIYEDISLDDFEHPPPGFFYRPVLTPEALTLYSLGNVNGRVFVFRARVSSRCAPSS